MMNFPSHWFSLRSWNLCRLLTTVCHHILHSSRTADFILVLESGVIAVGAGIPAPCLRSIISKQVESSELGTTFALVASLEVLDTLLASIIFNNIYSATVEWLPGFCYFLMSGLNVIAIFLPVWLYMSQQHSNPYMTIDGGVQSPDLESSANRNKELA